MRLKGGAPSGGGGHSRRDRQRQLGRGDRVRHGHLGDLRYRGHLGDPFRPGEEEEGRRVTAGPPAAAALPLSSGAAVGGVSPAPPTGTAAAAALWGHGGEKPPSHRPPNPQPGGGAAAGGRRSYLSASGAGEAGGTRGTGRALHGGEDGCVRRERRRAYRAARRWDEDPSQETPPGRAGGSSEGWGALTGGPAAPGAPSLPRAPCGREAAVSCGRDGGRMGVPGGGGRTPGSPILTAGPDGPGRPLSPGRPRGPCGGQKGGVRVGCFPFSISVPPPPLPIRDALVAQPPSPRHPKGCSPSWGTPSPPFTLCPPPTAPTQHSPSVRERRSLQGCQAHPTTTNNHNNKMQKWLFCPKKGSRRTPQWGFGGGGHPSSTAHLGTSRAGLTLGTIQTTEALGGRGGGSAAVGRVLGYRGGVPDLGALPGHPTSRGCIRGGMWHSLCVPSCPADRQFRGAHVRPTRKGLVVTQSHKGGRGGPAPHPLCAVHAVGPPAVGKASPGGRGGRVRQDGQVCQLHPMDKDPVGGTAPQR